MNYYLKKDKTMDIPPPELKKNDKFFILCELFLKKDIYKQFSGTDWSRERGAAKRLLNKYPYFDFFYSLNHLNNKFNSLLGISPKYIPEINTLYLNFVSEKQKNKRFTLGSEPVIIIEQKEKKYGSMIEFLDN